MFAVITPMFKQGEICQNSADGMVNSVDPDQTAPRIRMLLYEQSDPSLHFLPVISVTNFGFLL